LTPVVREQIIKEAEDKAQLLIRSASQIKNAYKEIADRNELNFNDIWIAPGFSKIT